MPSAMGNGVAFLHTVRRQSPAPVRLPARHGPWAVARDGVDFDALDGKPTRLFFVLGLKYDELFAVISKLARMSASSDAFKGVLGAAGGQTGNLRRALRCRT